MRICLLTSDYFSHAPTNDSACESVGSYIFRLAHGLNDFGHDVEVITLPSACELVPQTTEPQHDANGEASRHGVPLPTNSDRQHCEPSPWERRHPACIAGTHGVPKANDPLIVNTANHLSTLDNLNMLLLATPILHKTLQDAFALWQLFLERHLAQPFDVVQIPEHLGIGILPALAKTTPTVVTVHTPEIEPNAPDKKPFRLSGDELIVNMFERLCIVTADALCCLDEASVKALVTDLNITPDSIQIIHNTIDQAMSGSDQNNLAKEMIPLYQSAISKHATQLTAAPTYRLYLKDAKELLAQSLSLTVAFDKMIYDYLYQYSYRFRLAHWQRKAGKDPKRFARKALSRAIRPFAHLHPKLATFAEQSK